MDWFLLGSMIVMLVFAIFAINMASMLTLSINWKYYKPSYALLNDMTFTRYKDQVYGKLPGSKDSDFVWFMLNGSFRIASDPDRYIFNNDITAHDPYSKLWLKRYQRYALENLREIPCISNKTSINLDELRVKINHE